MTEQEIFDEVYASVKELVTLERSDTRRVKLLVIGCSTSEIAGGKIGKASVPELGNAVAGAVLKACKEENVVPAFQCCEHLNRALVIDADYAEAHDLTQVCAVPHPKAGGSCASAAYRLMEKPVLAEEIQADAGLDIGLTLIGMHLKSVAIPIRLSKDHIGSAIMTAALTRNKLIGGERAKYSL